MCPNGQKTAAALMAAITPTINSLLTFAGLASTPAAVAALAAWQSAITAVQNWTPGTASQDALEAIADFQTAFSALPLPPAVELLTNTILSGVAAVIGVISANSPAPAAPAGTAPVEEPQAMHQAAVAAETVKQIHALVPGIKLSRFHPAAEQYTAAWNRGVDEADLPVSLKVAA